jgi:hypothetical protein
MFWAQNCMLHLSQSCRNTSREHELSFHCDMKKWKRIEKLSPHYPTCHHNDGLYFGTLSAVCGPSLLCKFHFYGQIRPFITSDWLGFELRALCLLSRRSTTWTMPHPPNSLFLEWLSSPTLVLCTAFLSKLKHRKSKRKKKKVWYVYTMEFYSTVKKNKILLFAGKRMELENIILSEVSQVQKFKGCMFSLICGI